MRDAVSSGGSVTNPAPSPKSGNDPESVVPQPYFVCCEDCGTAVVGESEEAILGALWIHKMDDCG